jgi:hypothetical protein
MPSVVVVEPGEHLLEIVGAAVVGRHGSSVHLGIVGGGRLGRGPLVDSLPTRP